MIIVMEFPSLWFFSTFDQLLIVLIIKAYKNKLRYFLGVFLSASYGYIKNTSKRLRMAISCEYFSDENAKWRM